jgi:hypothetical protein
MWRAIAAAGAVVAGAIGGVVPGLVTAHPSHGLWAALAVTVIAAALLRALVTVRGRGNPRRVAALAPGSVAVGRNAVGAIHTHVRSDHLPAQAIPGCDDEVTAAAHSCGYVFVEADAGLGKTAFAAWLVRTRQYLSHFVRISGRVDPAGIAGEPVREDPRNQADIVTFLTKAVAEEVLASLLVRVSVYKPRHRT